MDLLPPQLGVAGDVDAADLSDEPQDFRFLSHLASCVRKAELLTFDADIKVRTTKSVGLPRRGEKDFEPHGTNAQDGALQASRQAMHDALAVVRSSGPGAKAIAWLDRETGDVFVPRLRGQHFRTLGRADRHGVLHLQAEEALYLVERGSLELRLKIDAADVPLSLQSTYALLLGNTGLSMPEYVVFAGLKRSGYALQRPAHDLHPSSVQVPTTLAWTWSALSSWWHTLIERVSPTSITLVRPGLYHHYPTIYRQLAVVRRYQPRLSGQIVRGAPSDDSFPGDRLSITFHVWKPRPDFRKAKPGEPDFRVVVIDGDAHDNMLTPAQLFALLNDQVAVIPSAQQSRNVMQRLRTGWRNIILAIVCRGVVSYLRMTDAAFGESPLFERRTSTAPKRGRGPIKKR